MEELKEYEFNELIKNFQLSYLTETNYKERLSLHRKPIELMNETLRDLCNQLREIQYRQEMRHFDPVKNSSGYVPSQIEEIWKSDKRLKSLFNSTKRYCVLYGKDFFIIATHIAEYRGLSLLARKIQRETFASVSVLKTKQEKSSKGKRMTIPYKVKAELLKEANNQCPFCSFDEVGYLQVHHIDEDPTHKDKNRLIMVCGNCHAKIGSKEITRETVIAMKQKISTGMNLNTANNKNIRIDTETANISSGNHTKITIKQTTKKVIHKYPPGCIGFEVEKGNYISYLINRYNEYKLWEVGKEKMSYAVIYTQLKRQFKIGNRNLLNLPVARFEELSSFIKNKIDKTKLAKVNGLGHKHYSSFDEFKSESVIK